MTTLKRSTVVGVFPSVAAAWDAMDALRRAGFTDDQIGMVTKERGLQGGEVEQGSHWGEGAAIGAVAGGALGAVGLAGAAAVGLMIPGFGPVFGAGILLAALTGASAGSFAGTVVGALIGLEIPEEEARFYESEVKAGRTLITVQSGGRHDETWMLLKRFGAYNLHDRGPLTEATERFIPDVLPVSGDELRTEGMYPAHQQVVSEDRLVQVPVRLEDLAGQETAVASWPTGEDIRIPIDNEELRPETQPTAPAQNRGEESRKHNP